MKKKLTIVLPIVIVILFALIMVDLFPLVKEVLANTKNESKTIQYVEAYGAKGAPVIVAMEALQVVVVFIPAAAIEILAGLCYGVKYGTLLCFIGFVLGNAGLFFALRQFKDLRKEADPKKSSSSQHFKWLNTDKLKYAKHPEYIAFLLYWIPGIPNGILPYVFSSTKISFPKFVGSMMLASLPSIFMCTWIGDHVSKGKFGSAIGLFLVILFLVILVYLFRGKIFKEVERVRLEE